MQVFRRVFTGGVGRSCAMAILVSQLVCLAATASDVSEPLMAEGETVQMAHNQGAPNKPVAVPTVAKQAAVQSGKKPTIQPSIEPTATLLPTPVPVPMGSVGRYLLDSGDKIKIRIYQREDLSGDFLVGTQGTIAMPLLGTFQVAGLDEDQVRITISNAARKVMERSVDVVVDVTERRPIYIVGYVEKPGVYPFALGMTVVHGLSMAGGAYRPQGANKILDFGKELTQAQTDTDTLKRNIVRLARLQAERDGRAFTVIPPELTVLAGAAEAADLFERERQLQVSETETRLNQLAAGKRSRELAKQELDDLRRKVAQVDTQMKLNDTRKGALKNLISKGFVRTIQVTDAETNDATLSLGKLDIMANITRATRSYEDLKSDAVTKELSRRQELDAQINVLLSQIDSLKNSPEAGYDGVTQMTYTLMRRSPKGYVTVAATDITALMPGDVLRVMKQK
jgi:protein involved in polysaccharide export with SLBB domain